METVYLMWIGVAFLFVFVVVVAGLKGGRDTQRNDNALDAMFRRPPTRPACRASLQRVRTTDQRNNGR